MTLEERIDEIRHRHPQHHLGHKSASITWPATGTCSPGSWTTWPTASTGSTRRPLCTQRVPTPRWPPLGQSKGPGGYQALMVEVGRLELPSRGVVPGLLRAQPPVEVRTRAVRWRRSRVLAS
jgi:hypothetical protein